MNSSKVITVLLAFIVLAGIASAGVVMSAGGPGAVNVDCIMAHPDDWIGKQVTVEGVAGDVTDDTFLLWNNCSSSSILVKWAGGQPLCQSCEMVVTGDVGIEKLSNKEQLYIIAEDWKYAG
jgi:hypothetical protein